MRTTFLLALRLCIAMTFTSSDGQSHSFYKDVLPILQDRCQSCHRTGEIGPMPLTSYKEVRPWAKSIQESIRTRRMPPWHADPAIGRFQNDPSLTSSEIAVLSGWVTAGAPEGLKIEEPPVRQFTADWRIGRPDVIFEPPVPFQIPAKGTIEYQYIILPTNFEEDRWVEAFEVQPDNRSVVHHAAAHLRPPGSKWLSKYPPGVYFVPEPDIQAAAGVLPSSAGAGLFDERLAGYVPGKSVDEFPEGSARLIPAGSDIVLVLHYTANGKPALDRTRIGLRFAKRPPTSRMYKLGVVNPGIVIPPRELNHREEARRTIYGDCELRSIRPHMHLRGKSIEFRLIQPDGQPEVLLRIPNFDFNWQLEYVLDRPRPLQKGSQLEVIGIFDNSANNPRNPDPNVEVRWGDQSWEEMLAGFFELSFDATIDPSAILLPKENGAR